MPIGDPITSLQNGRVKNVVRLNNRRQRDGQQQTVVEGLRECSLALSSGVVPLEAYICPDYFHSEQARRIQQDLIRMAGQGDLHLFEVSPAVFDKMAYRSGSGGVLLVIPYRSPDLDDLRLSAQPLLAVIDGAEKPGNVGAILRTADAAGVDGLVLTGASDGRTDAHNPNVIRASLGAYFTVPIVTTTRDEALTWFRANDIRTVAAAPDAARAYTAVSYDGPTAVIMGSEANGLSREWLESVDETVAIPMAGQVDSLNLSVSTALLLFEAVRQREAAVRGSVKPENGA